MVGEEKNRTEKGREEKGDGGVNRERKEKNSKGKRKKTVTDS